MLTTISVHKEEKERVELVRERARIKTMRETLSFLASIYEQLTSDMNRGEEVELVEAIERGELISFLKEKLCEAGNEVKAVVRRTDGKEVKKEVKNRIRI